MTLGGGWRTTIIGNNPEQDANAADLRTKAQTALTNNAAFLAIANPSAAQNAAQAKALTRQVNAVIRILLNQLADVSDT